MARAESRTFVPGPMFATRLDSAELNGLLLLQRRRTGAAGNELWVTDRHVRRYAAGEGHSRRGSPGGIPAFLTPVNGVLYFAADDGIAGRELWRTDGSDLCTRLVKERCAGSTGISRLTELTAFAGKLVFRVDCPTYACLYMLYKSNGHGRRHQPVQGSRSANRSAATSTTSRSSGHSCSSTGTTARSGAAREIVHLAQRRRLRSVDRHRRLWRSGLPSRLDHQLWTTDRTPLVAPLRSPQRSAQIGRTISLTWTVHCSSSLARSARATGPPQETFQVGPLQATWSFLDDVQMAALDRPLLLRRIGGGPGDSARKGLQVAVAQ